MTFIVHYILRTQTLENEPSSYKFLPALRLLYVVEKSVYVSDNSSYIR